MAKTNLPSNDDLDVKEIVSLFSAVAGELAEASDALADMTAVFEAIIASTEAHTLVHRLAKLGERLGEEYEAEMTDARDRYNAHAERFSSLPEVA